MDVVPTKPVWDVNRLKPTSEPETIAGKPQIVQPDKVAANIFDENHSSLEFTPGSENSQMSTTRDESKLNARSEESQLNETSVEAPMCMESVNSPMFILYVPEFNIESSMC
eukprot:539206_1